MSRLVTVGTYCAAKGAIVPLDAPLGSNTATCDWCGKTHKATERWVPGEGWVKWEE